MHGYRVGKLCWNTRVMFLEHGHRKWKVDTTTDWVKVGNEIIK